MKKPLIILVFAALILGLLIFVPDPEFAQGDQHDSRVDRARQQHSSVGIQPAADQIKALPAG